MVALKGSEIDRFVARPDFAVGFVLVYGPDDGLVFERAKSIVTAATGGTDDPFATTRIDGADVASDPARLADEALTIPLFGGRRVVWVRDAGARNLAPAVEPLLGKLPRETLVVVDAGDLKKGAGLRGLVESDPKAVAIPCYADTEADIARLIDQAVREAGLRIEPDARELLETLLGGDRLATRNELQKLVLYAHGRPSIDHDTVMAIIGDVAAFAMDELIDAVGTGDLPAIEHGLVRLSADGTPANVAAMLAQRHFQTLHRHRPDVEKGRRPDEVVERMRPPVFFKRKAAVTRQLGLWSSAKLDAALARLDEAVARSRLQPALADAIVSEAFLTIGRVARAAGRR